MARRLLALYGRARPPAVRPARHHDVHLSAPRLRVGRPASRGQRRDAVAEEEGQTALA